MSAISVAGVTPVVLSGIEKPKTKGARQTRLIAIMLVGLVIWYLPNPAGVDIKAWHLFAIFVATILGLILQPLPMGAVVLIGMIATALTETLSIGDALNGFSNPPDRGCRGRRAAIVRRS